MRVCSDIVSADTDYHHGTCVAHNTGALRPCNWWCAALRRFVRICVLYSMGYCDGALILTAIFPRGCDNSGLLSTSRLGCSSTGNYSCRRPLRDWCIHRQCTPQTGYRSQGKRGAQGSLALITRSYICVTSRELTCTPTLLDLFTGTHVEHKVTQIIFEVRHFPLHRFLLALETLNSRGECI